MSNFWLAAEEVQKIYFSFEFLGMIINLFLQSAHRHTRAQGQLALPNRQEATGNGGVEVSITVDYCSFERTTFTVGRFLTEDNCRS